MEEKISNKIIITNDGSPTLMSGRFGETYHSTHGAIQESEHVFLKSGLQHWLVNGNNRLRIFEMGLGSGLNVWLTCAASSEKGLYIDYHSVELYPLDYSVIEAYSKELKIEKDDIFWRIHKAEWDGDLKSISSNFGLAKYQVSLLEFEFPAEIDLVFYDAFAPSVQPELWTAEVFQKIFNSMNNGAILVTYCCKGDVRRAMISVGFEVERIAGPPGKREMIRATKPLTE